MSGAPGSGPSAPQPPFPPAHRRGAPRRWAVELAIVAIVAFPFAALIAFGDGRSTFATIMVITILGFFVGLPALVGLVAHRVWSDARDARASAAALGAALGWTPDTRCGRVAFVGEYAGRPAAVQATVRYAAAADEARRHLGARPVVRVWFEDDVGHGPRGIDLAVRGLGPDDARAALDVLVGTRSGR